MDSRPEDIQDAAELAQVRRQARKVYAKSVLAALGLTAVCVALPF
jgi:hypothetical protein